MKTPFVTLDQLKAITAQYPTPFHIYDEKGIRENARRLKAAFAWNPGYREYFAVKATPTPAILKLLKEVNQKLKLTIVVITHQMGVIKEICDRVAVMKKGRIIEEGGITEIFAHPQADLTKDFINTANNVKKFLEVVNSGELAAELNAGDKVLLLTYTGKSAGEPMVVALYERFHVRANIVFGNIDFIQGSALGKLGVVLSGEPEAVAAAQQYLKDNGVVIEEIS